MSPDVTPLVSVILPCRNEAGSIEACLRSVLAQEEPAGGGGFEVIVADGLSEDGTRSRIEAFARTDPRVRLIDNPGRIVSTGLNAAIAASRGEVIVRMDAHTDYAADYLRQCVAVLRETGAENVGGPWVAVGDSYLSRAIAAAFGSPFAAGNARGHDPRFEGPLDTAYLGCWPRPLFERVGLFDEELVRNQDDEHNLRITRAGGLVWQSPRIRSWYHPRSSLRTLFRQYVQYGYWKVKVIRKHGRPASLRHLVPVLFVLGMALGWTGWLIWPPLGWGYAVTLTAYLGLDLLFAALAAAGAGWDLLPVLLVIFPIYHVAYGLGFGGGLIDFVALRRGARASMSSLTRSPSTRDVA
jgi:succinoglycan biosynthesis protein ExoA